MIDNKIITAMGWGSIERVKEQIEEEEKKIPGTGDESKWYGGTR